MRSLIFFLLGTVSLFALPGDVRPAAEYQIPFVDSATFQKEAGAGLRLPLLWDKGNLGKSPDDLEAVAALSWNTEGLNLRVFVTDNIVQPAPEGKPVGEGDSVEFQIAGKPGELARFRVLLAVSEDSDEARIESQDLRSDKSRAVSLKARARKNGEHGYQIETTIPWDILDRAQQEGQELSFAVAVTDTDPDSPRFSARWQGNEDPQTLRTIRLVKEAWQPRVASKVSPGYLRGLTLQVAGEANLAGKEIEAITVSGKTLGKTTLRQKQGRSYGTLLLPLPSRGESLPGLWLTMDGKPVGLLPETTGIDLKREKLLAKSQVVADPSVFGGEVFPPISFADPALAENCLGVFQITTRFFDEDYNEVTKAAKPGRYGAVIEIEDEQGEKRIRLLSLYRTSSKVRWHDWKIDFEPRFATEFGWQVPPEQSAGFAYFLKQRFSGAGNTGAASAALIAALAEKETEDYQNADARWWIGLKRQLGFYPPSAEGVSLKPRVAAHPKPELRPGTEEEAGFKPGSKGRLEALCRKWAEETREPFAVCVARKGVILFNEGFGLRDGAPMSVDSPSWTASISKLFGAITLMRLVEQGKVDLDAPAARYLPLLKDSPVTVRQILLHVSGIGHIEHNWARAWSEPIQDIDAMVGAALYAAPKNATFRYSNAEFDLVGRIVESVTGEPCGEATRQVLFEPLGCVNTSLYDYAGRRSSGTALDYAKVGQMLLNGGTYGSKEILSPQTVAEMLPKKVPEGGNRSIGLGYDESGIVGYTGYAAGHGAASGATFRFMPEDELIVAITRHTSGPDHEAHLKAFIEALVAEMN